MMWAFFSFQIKKKKKIARPRECKFSLIEREFTFPAKGMERESTFL
jgi:hypothetical protein